MKRKTVYPEHKCLTCGELTTNKTYCDYHQKLITKNCRSSPRVVAYISAEQDTRGMPKRVNEVNKSI